jgi:hypothetical protein
MVDNSELTTISELTPHAIYTIRVQAFTSMGAGPMSNPVQVKTQQGKWGSIDFSINLSRNLPEQFPYITFCLDVWYKRSQEWS